jgi:hypothetical protein
MTEHMVYPGFRDRPGNQVEVDRSARPVSTHKRLVWLLKVARSGSRSKRFKQPLFSFQQTPAAANRSCLLIE